MALTPEVGAVAVLVLEMLFAASTTIDSPMMERGDFRAWCLIGAGIGALVKVLVLPPKRETQIRSMQQLAGEFAASLGSGFCLTPLVIDWCSMPRHIDAAVYVSFGTAIVATGVIHAVSPLIEKFAVNWTEKRVSATNPQ